MACLNTPLQEAKDQAAISPHIRLVEPTGQSDPSVAHLQDGQMPRPRKGTTAIHSLEWWFAVLVYCACFLFW